MSTHAWSLLDPALLERVKHLSVTARRVVEGVMHGLHRSNVHGLSIEFTQHREYSPGDEPKRLDWQVLARTDRYVVKQYQQETNLRAVILVDGSGSMLYGGHRDPGAEAAGSAEGLGGDATGSKFHYARVMAAALSYLMLQQGDSVGLIVTTDRIVEQVEPRSSPGHVMSICRALEKAAPSGPTHLSAVMNQLASWLKRKGLVIVISDLLDDPEDLLLGLGQLHHRGHEVVVFQVLDPRELDFRLALAGRHVTIIRDMETGEEFEAEPNLVRDLVRAEIERFLLRLEAGAQNHGLHLVRCSTSQPAEQVLTHYLHQRAKRGGRRT